MKGGRFKFIDKKRAGITIHTNPFPLATINMVSISAKSKRAWKEALSSQLVQHSKQVWRLKSIVVKENTRTLSHDVSRKNERKEWRPKLERRIETGRQSKPHRCEHHILSETKKNKKIKPKKLKRKNKKKRRKKKKKRKIEKGKKVGPF